MCVNATQIAGACASVGRRIHRELERCHLSLTAEMPRQQLVDGNIGKDLNLVAPTTRRTREKRSRCSRMNVIPACVETREHEHLIPIRRQRLENRRQLECRTFAFG